MRAVKIFIAKRNAFWFFNNISLGPHNKETEVFDYDSLSAGTKKSLEKYHELGVIYIKDTEEPCSRFKITEPNIVEEAVVKEVLPDFNSVTTPEEVPEVVVVPEAPPVEVEDLTPTEELLERSRALLNLNGNTIKKTIRALEETPESRKFLFACIEEEKASKNRNKILRALEEKFLSIPPQGA